uniref:hypothetical protein n=1 Tax=uncultured Halomonas sp. TaxID=173971 RepID=UPI002607E2AA
TRARDLAASLAERLAEPPVALAAPAETGEALPEESVELSEPVEPPVEAVERLEEEVVEPPPEALAAPEA